jgi:hypothetical protein
MDNECRESKPRWEQADYLLLTTESFKSEINMVLFERFILQVMNGIAVAGRSAEIRYCLK